MFGSGGVRAGRGERGESRHAVSWQCDLVSYQHGGFMTQETWFTAAWAIAAPAIGGLGIWAMKEPANFSAYITPMRTLIGIPGLMMAVWQFAISIAMAVLATSGERRAADIVAILKLPAALPVIAILFFVSILFLDGFARFRLARSQNEAKAHANGHADD